VLFRRLLRHPQQGTTPRFMTKSHFGKQLRETAAPGPEVARRLEDEVKGWQSRQAAYQAASSRVLAEELAQQLHRYNPSLTIEQCLARTYESNPQLYQAELSASALMTQRQTQIDDDQRRFA
jgi:hypothetical protein